ncbi:MAG TPA: hypothetical protein VKZ76_07725, partial [Edaphocola sp.]|nr:hypothetical protein [Edaphocola sp.]
CQKKFSSTTSYLMAYISWNCGGKTILGAFHSLLPDISVHTLPDFTRTLLPIAEKLIIMKIELIGSH